MYVTQLILSVLSLVQIVTFMFSIIFISGLAAFIVPEGGWMLILVMAGILIVPIALVTIGALGTFNIHKKKGRAAKQLLITGFVALTLSLGISIFPELDGQLLISSLMMSVPIIIAGLLVLGNHRIMKARTTEHTA
ncbi:hypothetical protein [Geomicrobium sp. JCM 19039]|uniref:hypothetical protein n=1 Tax=Geomicrobium sp. JCM 19039 TaxID=1460636 RepID=UPI00045F1B76|nr:hypothetical protein [Geomicrobium sp. JCM 19039]GAK13183.1 hypothetical protein JCM19039_3010 [Geomicrobium sp. JCM 19039]